MSSVPLLLSFLLMIVSGWVYRHQLIVIEFLQAETQLLKERLRGKRIRFTDAERALLARKAKAVGRKALLELDTIVSPDTLLRWHRHLVAQKWNFAHRRGPGRPAKIHGAISAISTRVWGRGDTVATHVAEFERIRRALRALDQGGMPESDDFRRAGVAAPCCVAIHRA